MGHDDDCFSWLDGRLGGSHSDGVFALLGVRRGGGAFDDPSVRSEKSGFLVSADSP